MNDRNTRDSANEETIWQRWIAVRPEERAAVAIAALAFFCLLAGIFLLRPVRDEMGLRGGANKLKYLWTVTLGGTLAASFAFGALASRWPRRTFTLASFRAMALAWLAFLPLVLFVGGDLELWIARAFYVVHAITNVLLVSLFWALLTDMFDSAQARRLFGLIAVGGTLGAIAGTAITKWVAPTGYGSWLILPAAILIEACVQWTSVLGRRVASTSGLHAASGASASAAAQPLGGLAVDGMLLVMRSPYLQAIALFTFLLGVIQTFLTFEQQHIVETAIAAKEARQEYFAVAENAAQTVTLLVQLFVTGALMRRIGVGGALLVLPIVGVLAFSSLGVAHTMQADGLLALVTVCTVAWRGLNNATLRPAREALYAPLSREEKYKAKSFSDTFAFRGGDLASAWSFDAFTLASAVFAAIPLVVAWGALGLWIGRRQKTIVNERAESDSAVRRQKI